MCISYLDDVIVYNLLPVVILFALQPQKLQASANNEQKALTELARLRKQYNLEGTKVNASTPGRKHSSENADAATPHKCDAEAKEGTPRSRHASAPGRRHAGTPLQVSHNTVDSQETDSHNKENMCD